MDRCSGWKKLKENYNDHDYQMSRFVVVSAREWIQFTVTLPIMICLQLNVQTFQPFVQFV